MSEIEKMEKDVIHKVLKVDNFFKIPYDPNMKIEFTENMEDEPFQKELKERIQLIKDIDTLEDKNDIYKTFRKIDIIKYWANLIFNNFTNNSKYEYISIEDIKNNKKIEEVDNIYYGLVEHSYDKEKNMKNKKYFINLIIQSILYSYQNLKKNGSCVFLISIPNIFMINILYFLTFIFEDVFIIDKFLVFCKKFKKNNEYINNIHNIEKNDYIFQIKPKLKFDKFIKYLKDLIKIDYYYKKKLVYENKYKLYIYYKFVCKIYIYDTINYSSSINSNIFKNELKDIFTKLYLTTDSDIFQYKDNNIYINEFKNINYIKDKLKIIDQLSYEKKFINIFIKKHHIHKCLNIGNEYFSQNNIQIYDIHINKNIIFKDLNTLYDCIIINTIKNINQIYINIQKNDKILKKNGYIIIINTHLFKIEKYLKIFEQSKYIKLDNIPNTITIYKKI